MLSPHRTIRSFVCRQGHFKEHQKREFAVGFAQYGLALNDTQLDFAEVFGRNAPVVLEIGFGMGQSLVAMAKAYPHWDFIGVEVHKPGIATLFRDMRQQGVTNIRVFNEDAVKVLEQMIPNDSLHKLLLFFPDPWHKRRHHKRRIVQPVFTELVAQKLSLGGRFHLATDWEDYAHHMLRVVDKCTYLKNTCGLGKFSPRQGFRSLTKFENRGIKLGHGVWDLDFERV